MNVRDRQSPIESPGPRPKLLVVELWGIGDLVFATTLLGAALEHFEVALLAKPHARALLGERLPKLRLIEWDAPWTAFTGKYRLWRWNWRELGGVLAKLRGFAPDFAASVRDDPRDHLLLRLAGAGRRIGFPARGSGVFLSDRIIRPTGSQHKIEDWRLLARALRLADGPPLDPDLSIQRTRVGGLPRISLHVGARIGVRRWPLAYFLEIVRRLRAAHDFHLTIIPDPDGYGSELASLADRYVPQAGLDDLIALLAGSDALICNDSGPGHLAAAAGTPVLAIFGPSDPVRYRPWGDPHHVVIRDLCPHRPCFDYCKFAEPFCMTRLTPDEVWPEIERFIAKVLASRA